jgi:hypothetical protein
MPSKKALLDQAAGVGLVFEEDSLQELFFLDFCRILWTNGHLVGVRTMSQALQKQFESEVKAN